MTLCRSSVQFSPLTDWVVGGGGGGMRDDSAELLFQSFLQEALVSSFWHGQRCPLFDVVPQAFALPTTASPTLQGALKDDIAESSMACDISEPCKFPFPDRCQKRFLWTHRESDLAPHPVVALP